MPSVGVLYGVGLIPQGQASPADGLPLFGSMEVALENVADLDVELEG